MSTSSSSDNNKTYIGHIKSKNGGIKVIPGQKDDIIITRRNKILNHLDAVLSGGKSLKDKNIYIQNIRSPKTGWSHEEILRDRGGVIDGNASGAEYWLALYKNDQGYARLFYRSYLNRKVLSHIRD